MSGIHRSSLPSRRTNKINLIAFAGIVLFTLVGLGVAKTSVSEQPVNEVPTQESKFQTFLDKNADLDFSSGREVLIVVPTSGCPKGIEWAVNFYQDHNELRNLGVKNMIVSPNPFIYEESPLPELLEVHYSGRLSDLNRSGFYPNAPQVAFLQNGVCTKFINVHCQPSSELASKIVSYFDVDALAASNSAEGAL